MMYIGRNKDGSIYGLWTVKQWEGHEELPDEAPDVVMFMEKQAAKLSARKPDAQTVIDVLVSKGVLTKADIDSAVAAKP